MVALVWLTSWRSTREEFIATKEGMFSVRKRALNFLFEHNSRSVQIIVLAL